MQYFKTHFVVMVFVYINAKLELVTSGYIYITLGMRIINIFVFFKKEVTVIGEQDRNASSGRRVREKMKGIYI